jgi:hypothetical protein
VRIFCATVVLVAMFLAPAAAGSSSVNRLVATVRPCNLHGFAQANAPLRAGRYSIEVNDNSPRRYFSLVGPSTKRHTTAAFVGSTTWGTRLAKGTYTYRCGPHLVGTVRIR